MFNTIKVNGGVKHDKVTFNFKQGVTSISGPNECGKSQLLEYMTFLLFGVAALRGNTEDYPRLQVTGTFSIGNRQFEIERSIKSATLYELSTNIFLGSEKTQLATGTKAVNLKVSQLLGYGYEVFQMANMAKQGEVDRLGKMKPSERKAAIDALIGLNHLDAVAKEYNDNALAMEKYVEVCQQSLIPPPPAPVEPQDYRHSSLIAAEVKELQELSTEASQLRGWLSSVMAAPVQPEACPVTETVEQLTAWENNRKAILAMPRPLYTAEQLDQMEQQLAAYAKWLEYDRYPKLEYPSISLADAQAGIQQWGDFQQHEQWKKGGISCPNCQHLFNPHAVEPKQVTAPEVSLKDYQHALHLHAVWGDKKPWEGEIPAKVSAPQLSQQVIDNQRALLAAAPPPVPADRSQDLVKRFGWEERVRNFDRQVKEYEEWQRVAAEKTLRLGTIEPFVARLPSLQQKYMDSFNYEKTLEYHATAEEQYQKTLAELEVKSKEAEELRAVAKALPKVKTRVKQHLTPALSAVAGKLLSQMTGGVRNTLTVDDDFNILVDGEPLYLLSGSAQSVANLALRLALGQVLTHRVFSVFIGDEIDASMDPSRTDSTTTCLRGLAQQIKQVILVSHKKVTADAYIEL